MRTCGPACPRSSPAASVHRLYSGFCLELACPSESYEGEGSQGSAPPQGDGLVQPAALGDEAVLSARDWAVAPLSHLGWAVPRGTTLLQLLMSKARRGRGPQLCHSLLSRPQRWQGETQALLRAQLPGHPPGDAPSLRLLEAVFHQLSGCPRAPRWPAVNPYSPLELPSSSPHAHPSPFPHPALSGRSEDLRSHPEPAPGSPLCRSPREGPAGGLLQPLLAPPRQGSSWTPAWTGVGCRARRDLGVLPCQVLLCIQAQGGLGGERSWTGTGIGQSLHFLLPLPRLVRQERACCPLLRGTRWGAADSQAPEKGDELDRPRSLPCDLTWLPLVTLPFKPQILAVPPPTPSTCPRAEETKTWTWVL